MVGAFNHNPNKIYGRTKAGTLRCWRDDNGLRFEVALPRHHDAEGLAESIKRGDVTQCSFSFRTLDDDWSRDDEGNIVRRLLKVDFDNGDVAAVTFPAYPDTDVSVRALQESINEVEQRGRQKLDELDARGVGTHTRARSRRARMNTRGTSRLRCGFPRRVMNIAALLLWTKQR